MGGGRQEGWPGISPSQRPNHRPWARILARGIFKIFNHRYGTDTDQPEQNAGWSIETGSRRHLMVPVDGDQVKEGSRGS